MPKKTIQGNKKLAKQIKLRRNELGLTIEEAASRASVGTKTWSRYESGSSIRIDKCKGICKALNWHTIPNQKIADNKQFSIQEYKNHEAWSEFLYNTFGLGAAVSFVIGSDILLDYINGDMEELASMPVGTHIGQLSVSWLDANLPEQFLMHYNYEFLYQMKCTLLEMRMHANNGLPIIAHSVLEELLLYLCCTESSTLIELDNNLNELQNIDWKDWIFDLFDDMDIISFLYSHIHLDINHPYHFFQWTKKQFYTN